MEFGIWRDVTNGGYNFFRSSRDQKIRTVGEYPFCNLGDLFCGLALTENDFRKSEPQIAMVIDSRECDVFIWQTGHLVDSLIDVYASRSNLLEQRLYPLFVHSRDCIVS